MKRRDFSFEWKALAVMDIEEPDADDGGGLEMMVEEPKKCGIQEVGRSRDVVQCSILLDWRT